MTRWRPEPSTSKPPLRLRVPASLAVALLGASATVAMSIGGCEDGVPEPADAGAINKTFDAGVDGGDGGSVANQGSDAEVVVDAATQPDAYVAPPDAYVPPQDAYVPPDTPSP